MIYHYLRFVNYIFTVFGIRKPFLVPTKTPKILVWHKMWSLVVLACMIVSYVTTSNESFNHSLKKKIRMIYKINDLIINMLVIVLNLVNGEKLCMALYKETEKILHDFCISKINLKMICMKMYLVFIVTTIIMISLIIFEFVWDNAFMLLITFSTYLSSFHLVLHLFLILAVLKLLTLKMLNVLKNEHNQQENNFLEEPKLSIQYKLKYAFSPDIKFFQVNANEHINLKYLCKIYDDLSTCIQLLEQHHGVQMLLTFWLIFTNGVFGITMIVCDQTESIISVAARSTVPFLWCFIGSFINDQINKEVEQIDMIIIKLLIDFRCDLVRKDFLQTFKQLIATNRLQFSVSSLFRLNYSAMLGTIVNVITYSIIMIQLFMNDQDVND